MLSIMLLFMLAKLAGLKIHNVFFWGQDVSVKVEGCYEWSIINI
jgi:hypothetical protein